MSPRASPPPPPSPAIEAAAGMPTPAHSIAPPAPRPSRHYRPRASPTAHPHCTPHPSAYGYLPTAFVHGPTPGHPPAPSIPLPFASHPRPDAPQYHASLKYPAHQPPPSQPTASSSSAPPPQPAYSYPYPGPPYAYPPYIPRVASSSSSSPPMAITLPYVSLPAALPEERDNSDGDGDAHDDGEGEGTEYVPPKRHACIMCHKSFDRPCTLRKHMKVHTGEREFECQFCSRRFGVSSNKKRHERKCPQRPSSSNPDAPTSPEQPSSSQPSSSSIPASTSTAATTTTSTTPTPLPSTPTSNPRKRRASPSPPTDATGSPPKPKRRRRAPSPSRWIPESLRALDLTPYGKATPVPLPPVQPQLSRGEERDSYDASVGADAEPYHPREWRGRLPGPALMEPECFAGPGGMGGRVLVL